MVVGRGISLTLHSPESVNTLNPNALEEFLLPGPGQSDTCAETGCTVIRYVPILPGSSFWLTYRILVPPSPAMDTRLYVFKLYMGAVPFATWSVDGEAKRPEQRWKGSCMFGLFQDPDGFGPTNGGRKVYQKRGFAFEPQPKSSSGKVSNGSKQDKVDSGATGSERRKLQKKRRSEDLEHPFTPSKSKGSGTAKDTREVAEDRLISVMVFRARNKKRIRQDIAEFDSSTFETSGSRGLDFKHAGYTLKTHPKRYYEFDLIDPRDQPYATFKFYYRTMNELKAMGIALCGEDSPEPKTGPSNKETSFATSPPFDKQMNKKASKGSLKKSLRETSHGPHCRNPVAVYDQLTPESHSSPDGHRRSSVDNTNPNGAASNKTLPVPPPIKLSPPLDDIEPASSFSKTFDTPDTASGNKEASSDVRMDDKEKLKGRSSPSLWKVCQEMMEFEHGGY